MAKYNSINMNKETIKMLPQWYKDFTKKDLILSNDIDSLLSIKLLEQVNPEWKLKYFYDFDGGLFYTGERKGKYADIVGVDIAFDYKDIKTFDNHVTSDNGKNINPTLICTDCITQKYNDVLQRSDKAKALLVCCHHLDIPFIYEIFNSLNVCEGLGIYIRQLNLTQNSTDNFEDGLINYVDLSVNPKEFIRDEVKTELRNLLKRMEETVNDL